ncbi:phosphatidylserine lipase ABHD16A-like [Ostrea edulis]|uniref:phosphatidylserine lipase ABHD16A-like n=1 Tax=Ostrea edulis TaxID=37623 RepID=UPI0024AFE3DF|nr:phosphatidylserine lipase ABHD16A-like [Ostrea edulis]
MPLQKLYHCLRGPKLYRQLRSDETQGKVYQGNFMESTGDRFLSVIRFCMSFTYWTSPVVLCVLYRRGYFSTEGLVSMGKFMFSIGVIYTVAYITRGVGRCSNADYITFLGILSAAQRSLTQQNKRMLARYDFEFWAWPVDWRMGENGEVKKIHQQIQRSKQLEFSITNLPQKILGYFAVHTFGRRMLYPGATALINALVGPVLSQSRATLVEEKKGQRAKLLSADGNEIDVLFVDRRHSGNQNGNTLVVCCEGNAGFYEIGCTVTPIEGGYSVLGWNHPGFSGSTGIPLPSQEQNAVDAVMQYAINSLGFTPDNIAVFAWSIGGYTASWVAMNYPDLKYIVVDATFDDLVPLAQARMPEYFENFVEFTVKSYLDLNITEQLTRYTGPILLIRRTRDEMITTKADPTGVKLYTNRGNYLLVKLLQFRYPHIADDSTLAVLADWLARLKPQQEDLWQTYEVNEEECLIRIRSYSQSESDVFPCNIGEDYSEEDKKKMVLYLASRYMVDFDSTHCNPLPATFFKTPWTPDSEDQPKFL